jgi:hypothetical protein
MSQPKFYDLIDKLQKFSPDEFVRTFGNIDRDIVAMIDSPNAKGLRKLLRDRVERNDPLADGTARLYTLAFGDLDLAHELLNGEVAAIDGASVLPLQQYSIGRAICVAVGSVSHKRQLVRDLQYWSTRLELDQVNNEQDFFKVQHEFLYSGISQTAVMRFLEGQHALGLAEPYIFCDGPIVYEWLLAYPVGTELYADLFAKKQVIGIIKNLRSTKRLAAYGSTLKSGELFILQTLAEHFEEEHSGAQGAHIDQDFLAKIAPKIHRGVFKPAKQAYGFEVHQKDLATMIRLMAADCALDHIGHEIPYLLNLVDKELRSACPVELLKNQIAFALHQEREELFFENVDEFDLR